MEKIKIDKDRCKGCQLCISACPNKCLCLSEDINKFGFKYAKLIDNDNCKSCGFCFLICPDVAIEVYK